MVVSVNGVSVDYQNVRIVARNLLNPIHGIQPASPEPFLKGVLIEDYSLKGSESRGH
jgi:hypothetical protein